MLGKLYYPQISQLDHHKRRGYRLSFDYKNYQATLIKINIDITIEWDMDSNKEYLKIVIDCPYPLEIKIKEGDIFKVEQNGNVVMFINENQPTVEQTAPTLRWLNRPYNVVRNLKTKGYSFSIKCQSFKKAGTEVIDFDCYINSEEPQETFVLEIKPSITSFWVVKNKDGR